METIQKPVRSSRAVLRSEAGRTRATWVTSLCAGLLGGVLLYLGYFPADQGWLAWFALVPFLFLVAHRFFAPACLGTAVGGLLFGTLSVQWVRFAAPQMYLAWVGLALLLTAHFVLFLVLARWLVHYAGWPMLVAAPLVWTALEYARAQIDIGFAWYFLGHTQHAYLPVIQVADLFGAYGISFLIVTVNVAVLEVLREFLRQRAPEWLGGHLPCRTAGWRSVLPSLAVAGGLTLGTLFYGAWRLSQDTLQPGPTVALVQGNVPQEIRNDPEQGEVQNEHFERLGQQAAAAGADLIVFPETSFTFHWLFPPTDAGVELTPLGEELLQQCQQFATTRTRRWGTALLVGINSLLLRGEEFQTYNSAILLGRDGKLLGCYHKCCRVPFGEYLPFGETLPFMKYLSPYTFDYGIEPGWELTLFELPGQQVYRFAVLICYEDTVPHLARKFLRQCKAGEPLDFFLNISNDGWFRGSEEHEQHLATARFRAVETRRALARAVNMGISAVIDSNGRIVALPGPTLRQSKAFPAIVTAQIPIDHRFSLYVWWGDVLPILCIALGLGAFSWTAAARFHGALVRRDQQGVQGKPHPRTDPAP